MSDGSPDNREHPDQDAGEDPPEEAQTHDFGDGNGPVPIHRHPNGGGWVANSAMVAETAYVGPNASVFGQARVLDHARVDDSAQICGDAVVAENARVSGDALVEGNSRILGFAQIEDRAHLGGFAVVRDHASIAGDAEVVGDRTVGGSSRIPSSTTRIPTTQRLASFKPGFLVLAACVLLAIAAGVFVLVLHSSPSQSYQDGWNTAINPPDGGIDCNGTTAPNGDDQAQWMQGCNDATNASNSALSNGTTTPTTYAGG